MLLPAHLVDLFVKHRDDAGATTGAMLIEILEQTHHHVAAQLSEQTGPTLFSSSRTRTHTSRQPGQITVTLNYRLTVGDFRVLDRLVKSTGAESRSHLVTMALTAFFENTEPSTSRGHHD